MKLGQIARVAKGSDWVLAQYYEYAANRDKMAEAEAITKIMTPPRFRQGSWSASSAGTCLRARQFSWLGMPSKDPDERSQNIFANGDYVHLRHQAFGMVAGYITDTEVPVSIPELGLRGTMDATLSNDAILEIKSINTRGFTSVNTFGAKYEHKMQVTAYMLATGSTSAHIVYEDKNTNLLKELVIELDEGLAREVYDELRQLNEATEEKRLLPMLQECRNGEGKYRWCPFAPICESAQWPTKSRIRVLGTSSSATD